MFTHEDRVALKRLQKAWDNQEFLYYHNTVTWRITKAPYVKDDVVYLEVEDQNKRPVIIEKQTGALVEFVSRITFGGEFILFDMAKPNRGWYARIPDNWAVVWKTKGARSIAMFDGFLMKTSFKVDDTIRMHWDMHNRIFIFHEDPINAKQKIIVRSRRPCININNLNVEKTFQSVTYRLQLFRFYLVEEKVIHNERVLVLTPKPNEEGRTIQDAPVRRRGMTGNKKQKRDEKSN